MRFWRSLPWISILAGPIAMIAPVLFTGKTIYWGTPFLQFVPWRVYTWASILQGTLPYWNASSGMGSPLIANYQSAVFYPPNWLLLLLQAVGGTEWQAWGQSLIILEHWIFAALGTAILLKHLGVGSLGQQVGALAFAMSGYLVGRAGFLSMNAAAAWLPWLTLAVDRLVFLVRNNVQSKQTWIRRVLEITAAGALLLLAGHAQLAWYILIFIFAWGIFRITYSRVAIRELFHFAGIFVVSLSISALTASVQLVPTWEYLQQSQRASAVDYAYTVNYSFWPWRLLTSIAPDLFGNPAAGNYWLKAYIFEEATYIGLLPLLLAATAILFGMRKKKHTDGIDSADKINRGLIFFLSGVIVISMLIAMGQFLPVFPFLYRYIPTFDMFQAPARFSLLAVFSLALLGGAGTDLWRRPKGRGLYWMRLMTAGMAAVCIGAGLAYLALGDIQPTFIRAAAMVGLWGVGAGVLSLTMPGENSGRKRIVWNFAAIFWIALDLCAAGWSLIPGEAASLYQNAAIAASKLAEQADGHRIYIPSAVENEVKFEKVFQVEEYPTDEDLRLLTTAQLPDSNLLDPRLASANNFDPLTPARYRYWMDYLESLPEDQKSGWLAWMDVSQVASMQPGKDLIQWNEIPDPAFYWITSCMINADGEEDAYQALLARGPSHVVAGISSLPVILEGWLGQDNQACDVGIGDFVVEKRASTEHILTVNSTQSVWLVVAENWYPGWHAEVDGIQSALYRSDYLYKAVQIPPGKHEVRIYYQPTYGRLCMGITLLVSLIIIVAYSLPLGYGRGGKFTA